MSTLRGYAEPGEKLILRLYLAGESPLSCRARENMQQICRDYLGSQYELEMIDVFEDPLRTLQDQIHLTPTLVRVHPTASCRIVGDLSQVATVLQQLGVKLKP